MRSWRTYLQLGQRKRELEGIRREISLVYHAVWMAATPAGQGGTDRVDETVRNMLTLDGWIADPKLLEQAGRYSMTRLTGEN